MKKHELNSWGRVLNFRDNSDNSGMEFETGPHHYAQDTELTDKKGNHIYEGDYLRVETKKKGESQSYIGQVIFERGSFLIRDIVEEVPDILLYFPKERGVKRELHIVLKEDLPLDLCNIDWYNYEECFC